MIGCVTPCSFVNSVCSFLVRWGACFRFVCVLTRSCACLFVCYSVCLFVRERVGALACVRLRVCLFWFAYVLACLCVVLFVCLVSGLLGCLCVCLLFYVYVRVLVG